jgi:hypothetical protein
VIEIQFCERLLIFQGTIEDELKARWTSLESISSQILDQPLASEISIAWIAPISSAKIEDVFPSCQQIRQ